MSCALSRSCRRMRIPALMARTFSSDDCAMPCQEPQPKRFCGYGTSNFPRSRRRRGFGRRSKHGWPGTAMPGIRTSTCSPSWRDATTSHAAVRGLARCDSQWPRGRGTLGQILLPQSLLALDQNPSRNRHRRVSPMSPPKPGSRNDWRARRRALSMKQSLGPSNRSPCLATGFTLHGTVLSASASASDAARRQVAVDTDPSFFEGLRAALRNAKPAELVGCALQIEDPRMPRLAGETVARDPGLLAGLDLTPSPAQAIWREALAIEPESLARPDRSGGGVSFDTRPPPGRRRNGFNAA